MHDGGIVGTGVDIVENDRMRQVLDRWGRRFKDKVFLADEQRYCESKSASHLHYAARFAVKEAVSKSLGSGIGPQVRWLDIEVVKDVLTGAPSVRLGGLAQSLALERGVCDIMVSLSHTRSYSVAVAVAVGAQPAE